MLRVAICDNEPLAIARLAHLLERRGDVAVIGTAADGAAAVALALAERPDALLLDIDMPLFDGFDVAEDISRQWPVAGEAPAFIFLTAHPHFAREAFDAGALDYVVKPVRLGRLDCAIERAISRTEGRAACARLRLIAQQPVTASSVDDDAGRILWVRCGADHLRIDLAAVERVSAEREYVRIFHRGRSYLHRLPLSAMVALLDPARFVRIHRSHVLRHDHIAALRRMPSGEHRLTTRTGETLPVGRSHRADVRAMMAGAAPRR